MPFEAYPPDDDGIILVHVWGPADRRTGDAARAATAKHVRLKHATRILVDFREARIVAPLYEFMDYYRDTARHYPTGTRLALVIGERTVPHTAEDMELARVVSLTGGLTLQDFTDMDEARRWLLKG